eukprot:551531_1
MPEEWLIFETSFSWEWASRSITTRRCWQPFACSLTPAFSRYFHEFGKLFTETENRREKLIINFIPYNPTLVEADFEAPTHERVREIQTLLINEYGCHVRIRKEMGQENQAACGQLALKKGPCDKGSKIVDDIEDLTNSSQKKKPKPSTRSRSRRGRPSENALFSRDLPIIFAVLAALIYYLL